MFAIAKRELRSYFSSPIGYVCMAMLLFLFGYYYYQVLMIGTSAYISSVYGTMFIWCMMVIPILTMRTFSEERKNKTDQALLTAPVNVSSIVFGKFLASFGVYFITMVISLIPAIIIGLMSQPSWGLIFGSFLGQLLYGAAMAAIGLFISSLTESQIIAAIGTFGAAVFLLIIDQLNSIVQVPALQSVFGWISFNSRYAEFTGGNFNIPSVVFFLSVAAVFLFLTGRRLEGRRQSHHVLASTGMCAGILAAAILVNVVFSILGARFPSMNIDTSKNALNTLTEESMEVVDKVASETSLIITMPEADANSNSTYKQVTTLAAKMAERNRNIKVEYVDLDTNPSFVATYKAEQLTAGDVIVKNATRYRVVSQNDMFPTEYDANYQATQKINVNGALASGLNYVQAEKLPVAAFDTGHGEAMDPTDYKALLTKNNFENKDFDLFAEEIPENTQLLVMAAPSRDFTDEEIKKLDDYLNSSTVDMTKSLLFAAYPTQGDLPKFNAFLNEWGLSVTPAMVVEGDSTRCYGNQVNFLRPIAQTEMDLEGPSSTYDYLAVPNANPVDITFKSRNERQTFSLIKTSDKASVIDATTGETDATRTGAQNVAAMSQQQIQEGNFSFKKSNVIVLGSVAMMTGTYMNTAMSNSQYLLDLSNFATGNLNSSAKVYSDSVEAYTMDLTVSSVTANLMGGIFAIFIPLALIICGIVVFFRRRHL